MSQRQWPSAISSHVGISGKNKFVEELICSRESAMHVYENAYEIGREANISLSSVRRAAKHCSYKPDPLNDV